MLILFLPSSTVIGCLVFAIIMNPTAYTYKGYYDNNNPQIDWEVNNLKYDNTNWS